MVQLFQKPVSFVITIDNKANPTSQFFVGGERTKVSTANGPQEIFTDKPVTQNFAVNSNFLSGEVKLKFQHLGRDAATSDEKEFQGLSFEHTGQMLEVAANLIREGKVKVKEDGIAPETYLMYSKEASLMFFNGGHSCWEFYHSPKFKKSKRGGGRYMYSIGKHCTVISMA
jgi:hypothetical protein